jgi:hypothetical protein
MQTSATKNGRRVRVLIEQGFFINTDETCAKRAGTMALTTESALSRI